MSGVFMLLATGQLFNSTARAIIQPNPGKTPGINERKVSMRKFIQKVGGSFRALAHKAKRLAVFASVLAAGALSARADGPDPTTIYSGALTAYNAAVVIAITAIGVGAVIYFIRKGLKARM